MNDANITDQYYQVQYFNNAYTTLFNLNQFTT